MLVRHYTDVRQDRVEIEGAKGVRVRWLISEREGAPTFALREFEIEAGGHTPYHSHDWEHEVFVLQGQGAAVSKEGEEPMNPGTAILVTPGEAHNFRNTGEGVLRFLCAIPLPSNES